jgi:hypothetical protein
MNSVHNMFKWQRHNQVERKVLKNWQVMYRFVPCKCDEGQIEIQEKHFSGKIAYVNSDELGQKAHLSNSGIPVYAHKGTPEFDEYFNYLYPEVERWKSDRIKSGYRDIDITGFSFEIE